MNDALSVNIVQVSLLDTIGYGHIDPTTQREFWNTYSLFLVLLLSGDPLSGGPESTVHTIAIQTQILTLIMLAEVFFGPMLVGLSSNQGESRVKWM